MLIFLENRKNPFGIFLFLLIIISCEFIGTIQLKTLFQDSIIQKTQFLLVMSLFGIWLGIKFRKLFIPAVFHFNSREYSTKIMKFLSFFRPKNWVWLFIFSLLIIILLTFSFKGHSIPLFTENPGLEKLKFAAGRGLFMRVFKVFIPLTMIHIATFLLIQGKKKYLSTFFLIISLFALGFLSLLTAYKAWFAFNILLIYLTYYYYTKRFKLRIFFFIILFSSISILFTTHIIYKKKDITYNLKLINERVTLAQAKNIIECLQMKQIKGYLVGKSFATDWKYLLGTLRIAERPQKTLAVELYDRQYGYNPYNMTSPPGFIGEMYLNFGLIGLMIFSLMYGTLLYHFHKKAIDNRNRHKIFSIYFSFILLYMAWGGTIVGSLEDLGISWIIFSLIWYIFVTCTNIIDRGARPLHK
ncbi:MAG: oligosaccharide repeat unit polymerase [Candidatus Helarchaeota archaeon]